MPEPDLPATAPAPPDLFDRAPYGRAPAGPGPCPRYWLGALTLALLAAIVVLQRPEAPDPAEEVEARRAVEVKPPRSSPLILMGKMLLGFRDLGPSVPQLVRAQLDTPSFAKLSAADEVRVVMLLIGGHAAGPISAATPSPFGGGGLIVPGMDPQKPPRSLEQVLDDAEKDLAPESPLRGDIAALRPVLAVAVREGVKQADVRSAVDALGEETRQGLIARHGWFGRVLMSVGDDRAPVRVQAASQAWMFAVGALVVGGIVFIAFIAGLALLITAIVKRSGGGMRSAMAPTVRPWSAEDPEARWVRGLWHETLTIFLLGFLSLKLALLAADAFVPPTAADWVGWASLGAQWLLLVCIFWPRVRGLSAERWRAGMGWHAPRGVGREVGAGLLAYLAGLPIYFAMAIVVVLLMFIIEAIRFAMGDKSPSLPPSNRITEIVSGAGPLMLLLVFLLATVWAPVVEESIFRGAIFRHLRGRWSFAGAAVLTSLAFAVMHGYMVVQLLMVFTLGFTFAAMREWRNSIVPSVTAHALHNGFVMSVLLAAGWFMRG
jgi:membrane protease YdiL (CAAX protease family)